MASGYPDWRPPGSGAGGRTIAAVALGAPNDVIAAPGAGFRIILFDFLTSPSVAGIQGTFIEADIVNNIVRILLDVIPPTATSIPFPFSGVVLAPGNKLRQNVTGAAVWRTTVTYVREPV